MAAIPSRQIGWNTESNLLWQIAKQIQYLTQVTASSSGGPAGPFKYNTNTTGIEPCLGTNVASGTNATIGGGRLNTASNTYSTIGGGQSNIASGITSTISGGANNIASGITSTISGGSSNTASGGRSTRRFKSLWPHDLSGASSITRTETMG